ncbi:Translation initiation factor IF-2 [Candidatus Portiera aleyrodidarum]|uniref:Translation initiation factor IF-2 n=1 Tax=Candidatus Portiera aleyrodidarum TV TaxID=1297582 RepID=A0A8D3X8G5_9GAMM|nr:translation initiation factor IF-2 [Candidatus Portiera aleyrodidarum]AGI27008.1 translation initiation factor IF-2 [Candidatus Portiera aleyrodidarum TV]CEI58961.1 Translation initiation factor IF-2 [Candidatus Portiera aleyrodidarum]
MVEITVKDFAIKIGCDIKRLLNYLKSAGLEHKKADKLLTEKDKQILLNYLNYQQGIKKITLIRKINSKIHMENKLIDIQIRKKKTFFKINTEKIERNKKKKDTKSLEESKNIHTFKIPKKNIIREINIYESNSILYLANKMAIKAAELIKVLLTMGVLVTINQKIDKDTACLVVEEIGHKPKIINTNELEKKLLKTKFSDGKKIKRCPIITVMGHVDHGKTSLIDCIRKTKLVNKELGGITQYIDVYHVNLDKGKNITIIDTPGHKAFINMRALGVKFTDIVILVVSADDGIKPQTIEAIEHAKYEKLPVIVAINKIDKIGTDIDRVRNDLSKYGLIPEEWGGDTPFIPVSAKTGIGIDVLLESVSLISELVDLTTVLDSPGKGVVIESRRDIGKGPVAKILVLNGTLNKGDIVLCGLNYGRVRAIINEVGKTVDKVGPSIPVEIIGLNGIPESGEKVNVVSDEKKAREIVNVRYIKYIKKKQKNNINKNLFKKINTINIVLKVDVQGTLKALRNSIKELSNEKIIVNIISASVGNINENDVKLAITSKAILIGFNVHVVSEAREIIERENIKLFYYNIIYKLIDGIKEIIKNKLKPKKLEKIIGIAEVRDIFKYNKKNGIIVGCIVKKGSVLRKKQIRIIRNKFVVYKGELDSLRRFKEDVNEVSKGMEFGICIRNHNDVKIGDTIESWDKLI